jgi:hypothetical protein
MLVPIGPDPSASEAFAHAGTEDTAVAGLPAVRPRCRALPTQVLAARARAFGPWSAPTTSK